MMTVMFFLMFRLHEEEFIEFWISSFCPEALTTSTVCQDIFTREYPFLIRMRDICSIEECTIFARYHTDDIAPIDRER